jgi:hypothetical protein
VSAPAAAHPPSFSVIIAAYEAAAYIGKAVESALTQTLPPLEVVICDDGSTDDLAGALARFGDRVALVRKQNGGAASARNVAARVARGDFVVILDADDTFYPERLEALAELAMARPDLDVLTTDAELEFEGRAFRRCYELGNTFAVEDQRSVILQRNFVFGLAAVRRERMLALGGLDERIPRAEDWELWIRLVLTGSRVGLVDQPLARYRLRPDSLSADPVLVLRGRCMALTKTLAHPALTADERTLVRRSLAEQRRQLKLAEARAALLQRRGDARGLALRVAAGRGQPLQTRVKAAASAIAPRWAARRLEESGPAAARRMGFRTMGLPAAGGDEASAAESH